ncbi:MAG: PAS domain S-box protein, partial [Syntrophobacteraceae bacterium]
MNTFTRARLDLIEYAAVHTLDEFLSKALDEIGAFVDSPIGFYHFVENDQKTLSMQQWSTRTLKEFCRAEGESLHHSIDQAGVWADCVRERKPVIHNDYPCLEHKKGMPEGHAEVVRVLVTPVMREGKVVAILGVGNKPLDYTEKDAETIAYLADVTWEILERKRAEDALRESELRLRTILQTADEGFWLIDNDALTMDANPRICAILGRNREEVLGRSIFDFVDNENRAIFEEQLRLRAQGEAGAYEIALSRPDGSHAFCQFNVTPLFDGSGNKVGSFAMVTDITERKRAEEEIRQTNSLLENILDNSPDAIGIVDSCGRFIRWNKMAQDLFGYTFEDMKGKSWFDLYADKDEREKMLTSLRREGSVKKWEMRLKKKDGSIVPFEISIALLQDSQNKTLGSVCIARDLSEIKETLAALRASNDQLNQEITERKQAEKALRESEEIFRNLFNNTEVAMFRSRLDGSEILNANEKFLDLVGQTREEVIRKPSAAYWVDPRQREEMVRRLTANGRVVDFEYKMLNKKGEVRDCITSSNLYAEGGILEGSILDITERVQQEREIELLNRLYCVLSHVSQAVVRAVSPDAFLKEACRIIVEDGDFLLCWIGYLDPATNAVLPAASWGEAVEYATGITVYADDRPEGHGPTGTCIRERNAVVYNDLLHDPNTLPWQERAAPFGIAAAAAFPIESAGRVWGALTIYSDEPGFFGEEDVILLEKVAVDIGFALDNLARERQRRQAEETLRVSEERHRRLFEDAVLGIFRSTPEGKIVDVNAAYARMFGFDSPEEMKSLVNDVAVDLYADPPRRNEIVRVILETGEPVCVENLYRRKDGSIFTANLHLWTVRDNKGKNLYLDGFIEDITERKMIEDTQRFLAQSGWTASGEDFFASLARYLAQGLGMDYVRINRLEEGSLSARTLAVYFDGKFEDNVTYTLKNTPCGELVEKKICCFPTRVRHLFPGDLALQEMNAESYAGTILRGSKGQPIGLIAVIGRQPLTNPHLVEFVLQLVGVRAAGELERKEAEEALYEKQARLDLALKSSHMGVWTFDVIENRRYFDEQTSHLLGINAATFTGRNEEFFGALHPDDLEIVRVALARTLEQDAPYEPEYRTVWPDGSVHCLTARGRLVRDDQGRPAMIHGVIWDVTDRKRAEAEKEKLEVQLSQAQKLEAIGTLAGGIAHDFNNLLTPMMGYAEMALRDIPQFSPIRYGLQQILSAALRARDLVKQILAFGRLGKEQQQVPVEISSIVKEALKLLRASLPSSIHIRHHIEGGVANADPTQIHQVLMNFCTNAAHAMDDKGILDVRLSRVYLSESDLAAQSIIDLKPGPYLKLSVSDTGIGMDRATLERIFDPYFTTKEVGKGSGLGLD